MMENAADSSGSSPDTLADYLREAQEAAHHFPGSHVIQNEWAALILLHRAFLAPSEVELQMGRDCIAKIRAEIAARSSKA